MSPTVCVVPLGRHSCSKCLCANALLNVCAASCLQVWMPEPAADGSQILTTAGLPFAVVGVDAAGTLLALFRCVSVRYRFTTDVHKPALMGAIGRVFVSKEVGPPGCTAHELMRQARNYFVVITAAFSSNSSSSSSSTAAVVSRRCCVACNSLIWQGSLQCTHHDPFLCSP